MDILFQLQLPILLFFQRIANSLFDSIAMVITFFGEVPLPLLITIFIYWCWDKKKGFVVVSSLLSAMMSMQIIKAILKIPRPFMKYPELITGKRQSTATGFSFPSGHSTTASAFYGSIAYNFRNKTIRYISIALIVLVPISRLYLGVHWPLDIIVGVLIGLISSLLLTKAFSSIYDNDMAFFIFTVVFGAIALVLSLVLAIAMDRVLSGYQSIDLFKASTFYRATHNLMQTGAIASGVFIGMALDRKYIDFTPAKGARNRALSIVIGLLIAAIAALSLTSISMCKYAFEFLTYAFIGLWTTFLFPLLAIKIGIMNRK